jgi:prevent-host-death family protein
VRVTISEAKAKLSKLVDMVYHGERVVITKHNLPLADIVPHRQEERRSLGILKGEFSTPDNFNEEDEELNALFLGGSPDSGA